MKFSRDDLLLMGAADQERLMGAGELSAQQLVEDTLARIEVLNPKLNAYRVVFAEAALAEAKLADESRATGDDRPMLGLPVAIKDDADVAGAVTAWGTDAYGEAKSVDSDVVARLRAAGAIVVGKTNVPELTLWPWTSSVTWGSTRNPWDTARTPGGSSGGSAAAVATGMCSVALGSDGGGSIRYPAAMTGLFGIKPQRDRIPLGPDHHDAWNGLSAYGPLARSVADAALFLSATADNLPGGGYSAAAAGADEPLRIAVSYDPPAGSTVRLGDEQRAALEAMADLLRSLGHHVFEQQVDYGRHAAWSATVRYVKGAQQDADEMARPERLERSTRRLAAIGRRIPNKLLASARRHEAAVAKSMNTVFDRADVVLTPMAAGPPPKIADIAGRGLARSFYQAQAVAWLIPWNVIGQPAASVPAGLDKHGQPLSIQLCGRPNDELTLLRLAAQVEQAQPWPSPSLAVDPVG